MKCPYCGAELLDKAVFCSKCGKKIERTKTEEEISNEKGEAETEESEEKRAGEENGKYTGESRKENIEKDLEENIEKNIVENIEAEERKTFESLNLSQPDGDKKGSTGGSAPKGLIARSILLGALIGILLGGIIGGGLITKYKAEIRQRQEQLLSMLDGMQDVDSFKEAVQERFNTYILTEEETARYEELLSKESGLLEDDYLNQIAFVEIMKGFEGEIKVRLDTEANALLADMKAQDPGYASDTQKTQLASYAEQMQKLIAEGKYRELEPLTKEWSTYAKEAAQKKTGYSVAITQYDFSRYPTVRLYLDVQDPAAGGIVNGLAPNMFYVSERSAKSGDFLNRAVNKAVQMNENERLNINLLADTSGSMMGGSMESAKAIMRNFINTVQFSAGDQVKLTQFNSVIDKSGYFTGDSSALNSTINSYTPDGQTKLYDAIIYGVQDVSGQTGARCVIAFTDGMDVGSYYSAQEVVNIVAGYKIPVFIVRIGDSSNSAEDGALRQIAAASGGSFKNLSEFSSDMYAFYDQIYRQLKQYYMVEYDASGTQALEQDNDISVYVQNQDKGGEVVVNVNPGRELFDSLLGSYLRSYINDMNNHSYNELNQYVDSNVASDDKSSIQWQMKKQVTGGFSNVTAESLMNYGIESITVQDENTVLLKANENYDVIYDEVYGDLKNSERTIAEDALKYLQSNYGYGELDDTAQLKIWAKVNQIPQYIIKRDVEGKWRFSKYSGDLALGQRRQVYDVEVTWQPYMYD